MIKPQKPNQSINLFFLLLLCFALYPANKAVAQDTDTQPAIQQMRLQVLPEYDDPRILVIAQGRLDVAGGEYNGPVTFRIPTGAQINQMAVLDLELGGPQSLPFETEPDPDDPAWMLVTYTLTNPHFFYEYYYNLPGSGSQKQFTFTLNTIQEIGTLSMEIQQPLRAEAFTLEPAATTSRNDQAGFTYWQYPDRPISSGEIIQIQSRYTKTDPNPSIVRQEEAGAAVQTSNPLNPSASNVPSTDVPASWAAITILGVALVIAAGFVRQRIRLRQQQPAPAVAVPAPKAPQPLAVAESEEAHFCTQCGQTLPLKARFCPYCGTGVRR